MVSSRVGSVYGRLSHTRILPNSKPRALACLSQFMCQGGDFTAGDGTGEFFSRRLSCVRSQVCFEEPVVVRVENLGALVAFFSVLLRYFFCFPHAPM